MITSVLQTRDGKWLHCFEHVAAAVADDGYRAEWYLGDLRATLNGSGLNVVRLTIQALGAAYRVVGACKLNTASSAALEGAVRAFEGAAAEFAKLDHATTRSDADAIAGRLGASPGTSRKVAERLYNDQYSLWIGLLRNWRCHYEGDRRLEFQVRQELDRIEWRLAALRRNFPESKFAGPG